MAVNSLVSYYPQILCYALAYAVVVAVLYVLNTLVKKLSRQQSDSFNLFAVLIFVISLYALFQTGFRSIFFLPVIILPVYVFLNRESKAEPSGTHITPIFVISFLLFVVLYAMFNNGNIYMDYVYYANVSKNLNLAGIETLHPFPALDTALTPYHYTELWLNALLANVFKINYVHSLLLLVYPLFFSLLLIKVYEFLRSQFTNKWIVILLLLLFPVLTPPYPFWLDVGILPDVGVLHNPKTIVIYLLIFYGLIAALEKKYLETITVFCLSAALFSTIAPGVYAGMFVAIIACKFLYKEKLNLKLLVYISLCALAVGIFYYFNTKNSGVASTGILYDNPAALLMKWTRNWAVKSLILLAPLFVFLWWRATDKTTVYLAAIFVAAGLATSIITAAASRLFIRDGSQVFGNFAMPVICFFLFLTVIKCLKMMKKKYIQYGIIILLNIIMYAYFLRNIPEFYQIKQSGKFNPGEYEACRQMGEIIEPDGAIGYFRNHRRMWNFRQTLAAPLEKLAHFTPDGSYEPYWLSVFDIPISEPAPVPKYDDDRETSQLYLYCLQNNINMTDANQIESAILAFIKEKNIRYILIENNAVIPSYIEPYVIKKKELNNNFLLKIKL